MKRLIVEQTEFEEIGKHLRKNRIYYISGAYSITVPSEQTKYLNASAVRYWPDLEGEMIAMLPGEAARTELFREFGHIKRVGWSRAMAQLFDWRSPMHYGGPIEGPMVLVDLKSAYRQIYQRLWLDTAYPGGYYGKYPLWHVALRLEKWKLARNSLVGIARSRVTWGIKGEKRIEIFVTNPYLSPGLWATVQHTLHWAASLALSFGAVYVNTDGYIFRQEERNVDKFFETLAKAELVAETKAVGEAEIRSWNSYKIGEKRTKPYRLGLNQHTKEFSNVKREIESPQWGVYLRNCANIGRHYGNL